MTMGIDKHTIFKQANAAVIEGNQEAAAELTRQALDSGVGAKEFLDSGLIAGMEVVGTRFRDGDIFLPEVLIAARAMKAGMELLKAELSRSNVSPVGKVVIGTVAGDLHDIGKNIVTYMLEGAGFSVIDLGIDVATETFVSAVKQHKPTIVGLSAFLTTTMLEMKEVIDSLKTNQLRERVRVIVGGPPVTETFSDEIGSDAYAGDARTAVLLCKKIAAEV
jgi:5-methyltetrahydrofolate--homocysteine methyltransferase